MGLQNVEVLEQQEVHKKTWFQRFRKKLSAGGAVAGALAVSSSANAATVMPDIDIADILTYIGLLVAAVATVGSAVLMIYLAAKGIKALRMAF